jgi:ABC-type enterochelin transport system permease subunit
VRKNWVRRYLISVKFSFLGRLLFICFLRKIQFNLLLHVDLSAIYILKYI